MIFLLYAYVPIDSRNFILFSSCFLVLFCFSFLSLAWCAMLTIFGIVWIERNRRSIAFAFGLLSEHLFQSLRVLLFLSSFWIGKQQSCSDFCELLFVFSYCRLARLRLPCSLAFLEDSLFANCTHSLFNELTFPRGKERKTECYSNFIILWFCYS